MPLGVTDIRSLIETDLPNERIEAMIAAAYEAIDERYGPLGPVTEARRMAGPLLPLGGRAVEVLEVVENGTPLEAVDWFLRPSGTIVERRNALAWRGKVDVTWQPYAQAKERDRVAGGLVKLEVAHQPLVTSVRFGSWSESYDQGSAAYEEERERILCSLSSFQGLIR